MSFREYLNLQMKYIAWLSKRYHLSTNEAALAWVQSGLAEKYARKYRPTMRQDTTISK